MARPRKNAPPDQFTSTEVAVGGGISARNFGLLQDRGLAPASVSGSAGRSGARYYDSFGVGHGAWIGAFYQSGIELLTAGRLAYALVDEFGPAYGYLPSKLEAYLRKPLNPTPTELPWQHYANGEIRPANSTDDHFWLHHNLRTRSSIYKIGQHLRGDFVLEIADRQYVFINSTGDFGVKVLSSASGPLDVEPSCRIVNWGRGETAEVVSIVNEIGLKLTDPRAIERQLSIENEFMAARTNAVSLLRINLSLAIRNAFDAIHDHRIAENTSLDWNSTARQQPGRYSGCDQQGRPLDPDHPWNRDLPPLERAKRLLEIEEIIAERETSEEGTADTS